jgi:hypothetical protein
MRADSRQGAGRNEDDACAALTRASRQRREFANGRDCVVVRHLAGQLPAGGADTGNRHEPEYARDAHHAFPINGLTGTKRITYPSFLPPPNVAMARAVMENGLGSPTVMVRVRR